jgi:hypothetical protein
MALAEDLRGARGPDRFFVMSRIDQFVRVIRLRNPLESICVAVRTHRCAL